MDFANRNPPYHPETTSTSAGAGTDGLPSAGTDPLLPLQNLSDLGQKMESLRRLLFDSIDRREPILGDQMQLVSAEISSTVRQVIANAAALLAFSTQSLIPDQVQPSPQPADLKENPPLPPPPLLDRALPHLHVDDDEDDDDDKDVMAQDVRRPPPKTADTDAASDCEIVEMDAESLLVEHVHACEICGKTFKRDANLRMHMRAHGNQFKTLEALSRPIAAGPSELSSVKSKIRFSCPYPGCNRNRAHKRFRPLKSVVCVRNHFKRSHCPKMYSCQRCNKKCFSVLADLKSHLRHCGETPWKCSCGTTFSRKDKLFGHLALFVGHKPDIAGLGKEREKEVEMERERENNNGEGFDPAFFEGFMDEIDGIDGAVNWAENYQFCDRGLE